MEPYNYALPVYISFGTGCSKELGKIAQIKKWEKCLIVTDSGLAKSKVVDGLKDDIANSGIKWSIFDRVISNPTVSLVEECKKLATDVRPDFITAIGGGSSIDVAKAVSLLLTNPGKIKNYELKGSEDFSKKFIEFFPCPLITVPTTAGTGSEVDFWAVITDEKRKFKMCIGQSPLYPGGPYLGAQAALIDPELTLSLPPNQTASTGVDALSHLIETFTAPGSPALVESLALPAIKNIFNELPRAYTNGEDLLAREKMLYASHIGGICENLANCGIMHSLAESTGGTYGNIPHGVAIAIFMPHVMEYNLPAVYDKYSKIAKLLGLAERGDNEIVNAEKLISGIKNLLFHLDLPTTLSQVGVKREDLKPIAQNAMLTLEVSGNPRAVDEKALLRICERAFE